MNVGYSRGFNFYNTTSWHQYRSAKKIEILTLTKINFSEEKCHENA